MVKSSARRRVSSPFPAAGLERTILDMNVVGPPSSVIARSPLLAEEQIDFNRELAVLVARSPHGQAAVYPVVETVQVDGKTVPRFALERAEPGIAIGAAIAAP